MKKAVLFGRPHYNLASFVGVIPARYNMFQSGRDFRSGTINWQGYPKWDPPVNCLASAPTVFAGPDGTLTASHLTENVVNGLHYLTTVGNTFGWDFGVQDGVTSIAPVNLPFRIILIAKADERTRCVVRIKDILNAKSCAVGFDLAGIQTGYDVTADAAYYTVSSQSIVDIGNGWRKCVIDFKHNNAATLTWVADVLLDNGSGTAARSISYIGDGVSGIQMWFLNMLPITAANLSNQVFFDDFNSIATIDMGDTRLPGFNWYRFLPGFNVLTPAAYISVANSILTISADVSGFGGGINTIGFLQAGVPTNYIGTAFTGSAIYETNATWDGTVFPGASWVGSGPSSWVVSLEGSAGGNRGTEIDFIEATAGNTTAFRSAFFDHVLIPPPVAKESTTFCAPQPNGDYHTYSSMILKPEAANNNVGCRLVFYDGVWVDQGLSPIWGLAGDYSIATTDHLYGILGGGTGVFVATPHDFPISVDWVRVFQ